MVPTFVTMHMFCASRDTQVSYGWCLLIQGYFCTVSNCVEKAALISKCSWYPKRKIGGNHAFLCGMPWGQTVSKIGLAILFMVASNLHINLFIKLCSLLEGIYCFDCLEQKRPNQNILSARTCILRGRGSSQPYLCDVKSSFDYSLNLD